MKGVRVKVKNINRRYKLNEKFLEKLIPEILKYIKKKIELEVIFLSDGAIEVINKRYLKRDFPTDVLSFKIDRAEFEGEEDLGEIFISVDTARENSKIYKTDFEKELVLYVIHGILHLFDYDDGTIKDKIRMSEKEREVLNYLCTKENLSKVLTRR